MFFHNDAIVNRANEFAEIAANTFVFFNGVGVVRFAPIEANGLVAAVFAGNIAEATMNALILVDFCDDMVVDVEVFPMGDLIYRFANKIVKGSKAFFIHPVIEPFASFQVLTPPMPLTGTLDVTGSCEMVVSIFNAIGFTAGPQ